MNYKKKLIKLFEDFPAAPVAPPRPRPAPAPAPTPTAPEPFPDPFKPPKPAIVPKPKNKRKSDVEEIAESLNEGYEEETYPGTVQFWKGVPQGHPFHGHPILSKHGHTLASSAFDYTYNLMQKYEANPEMVYEIFMQIEQLEEPYKEQLIELAKNITVKLWGVPKEMLDGYLGDDTPPEDLDFDDDEEESIEAEITPELQQQIHKRITLNSLSQGAAIHAMHTMHYLVEEEIKKINPELLRLYSIFAGGAQHGYWSMPLPLPMLEQFRAGFEKVEYLNDQPFIIAYAKNFPILCQEFSKGVMEFLSFHGLEGIPPEQLKAIYKHADRTEDEPYYIQVSPELWRRFLRVVPKGKNLSEIVMKLAKMPPKRINTLLSMVVDNPEDAKKYLGL